MFKRKEIKKSFQNIVDQDNERHEVAESSTVPLQMSSKIIHKQKSKGVSVKELSQLQASKREMNRGMSLEDQAHQINIQYTKSMNQQDRTESLLDKYVTEQLQKHFMGDSTFNQQEVQDNVVDPNEENLEEILEVPICSKLNQKIQNKYLNKQDQDQAVWVGGIMEVNLSLEEKAQKIAQMEEVKRSEYFKSLITGTVYKKKIQIPVRKSQQEKEEEVQDKFLKEISDRFYHRGRIYKHSLYTKNQENNRVESKSFQQGDAENTNQIYNQTQIEKNQRVEKALNKINNENQADQDIQD